MQSFSEEEIEAYVGKAVVTQDHDDICLTFNEVETQSLFNMHDGIKDLKFHSKRCELEKQCSKGP